MATYKEVQTNSGQGSRITVEALAMAKGSVLWFNEQRGFGRIVDDETQEECFFHISDVIAPGTASLVEDEPVTFEKGSGEKGPVATMIERLDVRLTGSVEEFRKDRGFGYISSGGGDRFWVHFSCIVGNGFKTLDEGEQVEFTASSNERGRIAIRVKRMGARLALDRFAFFPNFDAVIDDLARCAQPEQWDYTYTPSPVPNPILRSYFQYTYDRIDKESKVAFANDGGKPIACFNTGLVTDMQEQIFAYFEPARQRSPGAAQWLFNSFITESDRKLTQFKEPPDIANYFDEPSDLIYDTRINLLVDLPHIVQDNLERFPEDIRDNQHVLLSLLEGAISKAKRRVRGNYKAAIPQFYRDRLQLLLPLCLREKNRADLALVVERQNETYFGSTVLPLDWAYRNARLIARPDREWLEP